MKKHKTNKHNYRSQNTPVKEGVSARVIKKVLFGLLVIVLFFASMYGVKCGYYEQCEIKMITKYIRHDVMIIMPKGVMQVEVASTKASREQGLSGRESMGDDEGLLFVFETPGKYGFWMKDMKFPLDLIWISENGTVVDIERNLTPDSYPKTFINEVDAMYVLEINGGLAQKFGLFLGTKVKITQ